MKQYGLKLIIVIIHSLVSYQFVFKVLDRNTNHYSNHQYSIQACHLVTKEQCIQYMEEIKSPLATCLFFYTNLYSSTLLNKECKYVIVCYNLIGYL